MDLTPLQKHILKVIRTLPLSKTFYWTGGTLLSYYYLKHRHSFDIDFFTDKPFPHDILLTFITEVKRQIPGVNISEKKISDRWEYLIETKNESTRCEFVYYNGSKKRLVSHKFYKGIMIDSLADIAANKTMAYFDRNEPKDLFDLWVLLSRKKYTVQQLLEMVENKFGSKFTEFSFWSESSKSLKQLQTLVPYLIEPNEKKQIQIIKKVEDFFLEGARSFLSRQFG